MPKAKKASLDMPLFQGMDIEGVEELETVSEENAQKYKIETVDFGDRSRPQTCLEVDFPILQVNEVAMIENNATKPIYMMSKWWARRRSAIFRQLLISAALKAPKDKMQAAQVSWSQMYRKAHRRHGLFRGIKVLDIFMGGGTTVVEAARLGFDVTGNDLNPIAWWVVRNETNPIEPDELKRFYEYIVGRVKPQILPYFTAKSPRGFQGSWIETKTGKSVEDPKSLPPEDRSRYSWQGPETIYTFWMKHIMCSDPECFHLTPQLSSAVVAEKSAKIKCIENCVCPHCGDVFDLELTEFRMAPKAKFLLGEDAMPFAIFQPGGAISSCPHCRKKLDEKWISSQKQKSKKSKSREVTHYLVLPKTWLNGISAKSKDYFGGYYGSSREQDVRWFTERSKGLDLIEVRGIVPKSLEHNNFGKKIKKTSEDGDADGQNSRLLVCAKCGRQEDPLSAIKLTGIQARVFPYLIHGYDPEAKQRGFGYNGRFFDVPDFDIIQASIDEFASRSDVRGAIPTEELFYGYKTHFWAIPEHGYTHWYKMFTPRQLLVNSILAHEIENAPDDKWSVEVKSHMFGAFQNYLRHNCVFAFWNRTGDKLEPHFSRNNYHPKATFVENGVFSDLGRGNFASCFKNVFDGLEYAKNTYDLSVNRTGKGGKSEKQLSHDTIQPNSAKLLCSSSTDLRAHIGNESIDLIITDPPFGDNVNYAELADFFLVWLHRPLHKLFPEVFLSSESPKTLEAVTNKARHSGVDELGASRADQMYDRLLTLCWKEAYRVLRPAGIMAFTFHHDKDVAWIGVLESLFKAGFLIEGTFPVRSDESKGDGDFGSEKIEFDIVHICKKRLEDPQEIFWATLRKRILEAIKAKSSLLARHKASGLHLADLEVMVRGEVLEQYSRHYGKVQKNLSGDLISVREILLEANSMALSLLQSSTHDAIPDGVDPEARVLLNLFSEGPEIEFSSARKRLKGSGVSLEDLVSLGWVSIQKKDGHRIATVVSIVDRWNSLARKKSIKSDWDQVHFAVNCCLGDRLLDGKPADLEIWIGENYKLLIPSVGPLLKYIEGNHFGDGLKQVIGIARRTLDRTLQSLSENDAEFRSAAKLMSLFKN